MAAQSGGQLATQVWKVPVSGKKCEVAFHHNSLTGRQTLWLDGERIFHSGWKYELIGEVSFEFGDSARSVGKVVIQADGVIGLKYTLYINNKSVGAGTGRAVDMTVWDLPPTVLPASAARDSAGHGEGKSEGKDEGSGPPVRHLVEFDHSSLEVWVDDRMLSLENGELMADFLEGDKPGAAYRFTLPHGVDACIEVTPGSKGGSTATLTLDPDGKEFVVVPITAPVARGKGAAR